MSLVSNFHNGFQCGVRHHVDRGGWQSQDRKMKFICQSNWLFERPRAIFPVVPLGAALSLAFMAFSVSACITIYTPMSQLSFPHHLLFKYLSRPIYRPSHVLPLFDGCQRSAAVPIEPGCS